MRGYCVICRTMKNTVEQEPEIIYFKQMKREAKKGTCPTCGNNILKFAPKKFKTKDSTKEC